MILCVGEILVDMIAQRNELGLFYLPKAGGAPFNVCCGINKFRGISAFAGTVGNDSMGELLIEFVKKQGIADYKIDVDDNRNTTLAFVNLDEDGERSFCFYRKNTADYHLNDIDDEMLMKANIIHIGSLMISANEGYDYAIRLAKRAKESGKIVSFDVNYRDDIFSCREEAIKRYKDIINYADIVKFSSDEEEIFGRDYLIELSKSRLICLSLGASGSEYLYKSISGKVPSIKVRPFDTTGAGDAFYAGILSKLDGFSMDQWDDKLLKEAFLFGNVSGALNTLGKGAIDNLPSYQDVIKKIKDVEI